MTPMRISVGVMPTSEAVNASFEPLPVLCAVAVPASEAVATATSAHTAIHRNRLTACSLSSLPRIP